MSNARPLRRFKLIQLRSLAVESRLLISEPPVALALSNSLGFALVATKRAVTVVELQSAQTLLIGAEPRASLPLPEGPRVEFPAIIRHLRCTSDERTVWIGTEGGTLYCVPIAQLLDSKTVASSLPSMQIPLDNGTKIKDMRPNPEFMPGSCAVLLSSGRVVLVKELGTPTVSHSLTGIRASEYFACIRIIKCTC